MVPSEFNSMEWLAPWSGIAPGVEAQQLKLQLKREVGLGHALYRKHAIPLARRIDNDDVLFYLPEAVDKRLAVVHLTWVSSSAQLAQTQLEQPIQAELPYTVYYSSVRHWVGKCMIPDHREYMGPSPHYSETIEQLKGLYDGSEPGWVLVDLGPDEFDGTPTYSPTNILTHAAIIIDDDDAYKEIVHKMLAAGVPIVAPDEVRE